MYTLSRGSTKEIFDRLGHLEQSDYTRWTKKYSASEFFANGKIWRNIYPTFSQ